MQTWNRPLLFGILTIALGLHLWGIRHDLPYVTEDPIIVKCAALIAATGTPNPRWFGHPGSTLIYPLAPIYHVWHAAGHGGSWLHPDPRLRETLKTDPAAFYLLGRLLTVVYALLSIVIVYRIGRQVFGTTAALIGALLSATYPTDVFAKVVRTDSASVLFGMLGLWCCLRLYQRPMITRHVVAGTAIGLAISTKYYLGTLIGVLLLVDGVLLWQRRSHGLNTRDLWRGVAGGLLGVMMGFAISTPYFFLDHQEAMRTLKVELRSAHPGADGLSPLGNLLWYLTTALPPVLRWPQLVAACTGMFFALRERRAQPLLMLAFVPIFLASISFSALHWGRWVIPILPVFALFAAHGLDTVVRRVVARVGLSRRWGFALLAAGTVSLVAQPLWQVVQTDRVLAQPSTAVVARHWIEQNISAGSHIAYEWETLPYPLGPEFHSVYLRTLAMRGMVRSFAREGFRYLVTSSLWYEYYPANPDRYPREAAFYRALLTHGKLVYEVQPSSEHSGPGIRIYEIAPLPRG